jgi:RecJ-like exonuclease
MKKLTCKAFGEKIEILELTFSEFIKKFRPLGYTTIEISGAKIGKGGLIAIDPVETIKLKEVICDFCNDEIKPKVTVECDTCRGAAVVDGATCSCETFDGSGYVETDEESKIYIDSSYAMCRKCFMKSYKVIEGD